MNRDHWDVYVPKDINVCVTIPDNLLSGAISCENIVHIPLYRNLSVRKITATTYIPPAHNMAFPF